MRELAFTLNPEAVVRIHDILICIAKFNEAVNLEADDEKVVLTAYNSSKTSYASFALLNNGFFQSYRYKPEELSIDAFECKILVKSLLSVFKGRASEFKDGENSIERCDVSVQEYADQAECRFTVKMICRHGVKKTYKLNYAPSDMMRLSFDGSIARNRWTISAHILRTFSEFFGAKTENLDMCYDAGRMTFNCFTEKIVHQAEVLKQPLHTSVAINIEDFEDYNLEEKLKVGIGVKDFKAIIMHAVTLKTSITTQYSGSGRPMQLVYSESGMQCKFIVMTSGDARGTSVKPGPTVSRASASQSRTTGEPRVLPLHQRNPPTNSERNPSTPSAPRNNVRDSVNQRNPRPSPPAPRASVNEESLFVMDEDEEEQVWGERDFEEDEGELKWDSGRVGAAHAAAYQSESSNNLKRKMDGDTEAEEMRVAPTQRLSQIKGLFD